MHSMREAAREIAAREAEDEGLSERSVSALAHERREAQRLMRLELALPKQVPHVVDEGSDRVALDALKAMLRGPMRPVQLRDMLGIASRSYFTLHYLSPLAKAGYIEMVDGVNKSSCRCAYRLTRKGVCEMAPTVSHRPYHKGPTLGHYKAVDSLERLLVLALPVGVFVPSAIVPEFLHAMFLRRRFDERRVFAFGFVPSSSTSRRSW